MRWPWWPPPRRGEIIAVSVVAVMGIIFLFALVRFPQLGLRLGFNWGFGSDWNCTRLGEAVCFKRPPTDPARKPPPSN